MSFSLFRGVRRASPAARASNVYWPPRFARLWPHRAFRGESVAAGGAAATRHPRGASHPAAPRQGGAAQPARRTPEEVTT
jgi:hypothetical protein